MQTETQDTASKPSTPQTPAPKAGKEHFLLKYFGRGRAKSDFKTNEDIDKFISEIRGRDS